MNVSDRRKILEADQATGLIRDLEISPRFRCVVNDVKIGVFSADFTYYDVSRGTNIAEIVRGNRSAERTIQARLILACHDTRLEFVK